MIKHYENYVAKLGFKLLTSESAVRCATGCAVDPSTSETAHTSDNLSMLFANTVNPLYTDFSIQQQN